MMWTIQRKRRRKARWTLTSGGRTPDHDLVLSHVGATVMPRGQDRVHGHGQGQDHGQGRGRGHDPTTGTIGATRGTMTEETSDTGNAATHPSETSTATTAPGALTSGATTATTTMTATIAIQPEINTTDKAAITATTVTTSNTAPPVIADTGTKFLADPEVQAVTEFTTGTSIGTDRLVNAGDRDHPSARPSASGCVNEINESASMNREHPRDHPRGHHHENGSDHARGPSRPFCIRCCLSLVPRAQSQTRRMGQSRNCSLCRGVSLLI